MKITEIKVAAGRTFNHPFESYSNLRFDLHFNAQLDDADDPAKALEELQARAEEAAERHKEWLLSYIRELDRIARATANVSDDGLPEDDFPG